MAFTDYGTVTTSHTFNKTYYKGNFLKGQEQYVVLDQFAKRQKDANIPINEGDTVKFSRVAPFAMKRTALTEGTNPNATKIYGNTVSATVEEYGDYVKPSKKYWLTNMDKDLAETSLEFGKAAAKTIDSLIWEAIAEGGMGLRADVDSTYMGETACADSCTTTSIILDALPTSITTAGTGVIVFLDGKNAGLTREFTYSDTNTVTVAALDNVPDDGDRVWVCATNGITSGDEVTAAHIQRAVAILDNNGCSPFDDGFYHAVYSAFQKYDFQRDSEWTNLKHEAAPKDLYRNLEGEIYGAKFHKDNNPYRMAAGAIGTYSATGAVHCISIFGKGAFGNVRLKGIDRKFYVNPPASQTENPLAMYGTIGWYDLCCPVVLDGRFIVNIFNKPSLI
ncbi:MAG: N4-gp56 family major capsid protein [Eubacteriales bacterium]